MVASNHSQKAEKCEQAQSPQAAPRGNNGLALTLHGRNGFPRDAVGALNGSVVPAHVSEPQDSQDGESRKPPADGIVLIQIPPERIPDLAPMAAAMLLKPAEEHGYGEVDIWQALQAAHAKQKQLWMILDTHNKEVRNKAVGVAITSLRINADKTKSAIIEALAGEQMKDWFHLRNGFEEWAAAEGCDDVRVWARKGWLRHIPDYKVIQYVLRKQIVKAA